MLLRCIVIASVVTCGLSVPSGELFRDLELRHGFNLSAVNSRSKPLELGPILQADDAAAPAWRLAQWGTNFDLWGAPVVTEADGARAMENEAKRVAIHPGGLAGDGVTLTVLGAREYGGALRKKGEAWPHLLIEQKLPKERRLASFEALEFGLEFRVARAEVAVDAPVTPSLHTGQVSAFFTLHNRNPDSPDFGDMIWFGLPVFDARHDLPRGHQAVDGGKENASGKFICTLPGERFYDTPTGDGQWHRLSADLLPLVREALAASQAKGFLTDTAFSDLGATSFNLGWEAPGPYDCSITVKGLHLKAR